MRAGHDGSVDRALVRKASIAAAGKRNVRNSHASVNRLPFQLATFLGAFLLFLVEPLIAKQILPWFGGTPAVWTTCLVFFQLCLVAGYAYPHLTKRLSARKQVVSHLALLVLVSATLPITASPAWKAVATEMPALRVLSVLAVTVGAPYIVLSATAPLVQAWYRRAIPGRSPYALYVLSNLGSLLALLSYPAVLERFLTGRTLAAAWSAAFVVFVAVSAWCGWHVARASESPAAASTVRSAETVLDSRPPRLDRVLWIALSGCGSALLLASTNQLCQNVAVVPLLWVVPLALYLATYIVCFARWYSRPLWATVFILAGAATTYVLVHALTTPVVFQAGAVLCVLWASCMVCHGELVRLSPPPHDLTLFYLSIAVGGSLGGLFVGVLAPVIFTSYVEFPLLLVGVLVLLIGVVARDAIGRSRVPGLAMVWTAPVIALAVTFSIVLRIHAAPGLLATVRNFYGILTVVDETSENGSVVRELFNGRVLHGSELLSGVARAQPTTYYASGSGIAVAIQQHPRRLAGLSLNVGVVGLGAGTIAAWGQPGDAFRFFEINPKDVEFANRYFTFLRDSRASIDVVLGDGRSSLERELARGIDRRPYDVLAIDAFSGDSIPVHLLTREAFDLYWRALSADGVLAVHVSNAMIDLEPVVRGLAAERGLDVFPIARAADPRIGAFQSAWMLVTASAAFRDGLRSFALPAAHARRSLVWTDDFSSVVSVLR